MSPFQDQQTFLNYFQNELWVTRTEKFLSRLEQVIPWNTLVQKIEYSRKENQTWAGRPRTDTLRLIKILFLQWVYSLSDPEAEDQIRDRKSFQVFLKVREVKDIPDETTICRFRNELVLSGIQESIFTLTQNILSEMGFTVKEGCIQDGTIIEAPKWRKKNNGETTRDPDASFTKKNGRNYHGYKGHIETSEKGDFIMNTTYTTASVHDSQASDALMTWEEEWKIYG